MDSTDCTTSLKNLLCRQQFLQRRFFLVRRLNLKSNKLLLSIGSLILYLPTIKSEKLFIEVKSKYTLLLNPIKNFAKFKSIIDRGYNINIIIIDKPKKNEIKYKIYTYENIKAYIESIKG